MKKSEWTLITGNKGTNMLKSGKIKLQSSNFVNLNAFDLSIIQWDFMERVLEHGEALITDKTTVGDFIDCCASKKQAAKAKADIIKKAKKIYKVDITPVVDMYLPIIFAYISIELA